MTLAYWLLLGFWDAVGLLAFGILSAFWMLLFFIDGLEGIPSAFGILLECFGTSKLRQDGPKGSKFLAKWCLKQQFLDVQI